MKNTADIRLDLTFGHYDNRGMFLEVLANDLVVFRYHGQEIKHSIRCNLDLPGRLEFQLSGKNLYDTAIDGDGNILADKFVRVDNMSIDGIWIQKWLLESRVFRFMPSQGETRQTNYFGNNGTAVVQFESTDILDFWLDLFIDHRMV